MAYPSVYPRVCHGHFWFPRVYLTLIKELADTYNLNLKVGAPAIGQGVKLPEQREFKLREKSKQRNGGVSRSPRLFESEHIPEVRTCNLPFLISRKLCNETLPYSGRTVLRSDVVRSKPLVVLMDGDQVKAGDRIECLLQFDGRGGDKHLCCW